MARLPMYRVIEKDLTAQIESAELKPNAKLPGEHALASRYGVSRMTVRQALNQLEAGSLITKQRGSGTFVSPLTSRGRRLNRLKSFSEELSEGRHSVTTRVLRFELEHAAAAESSALRVPEGRELTRFARLRLVDGQTAAMQDSWIPYSVAPGLVRDGIIEGSLYRTLRERYGIELKWADQIMTAALLDEALAQTLGVEPGSAVLHTTRTTYDDSGEAVEYAQSWTLPEFPLSARIEA